MRDKWHLDIGPRSSKGAPGEGRGVEASQAGLEVGMCLAFYLS